MKQMFFKIYAAALSLVLSMPLMITNARASAPLTGDERGRSMWIVLILLGVSAAVIIGYFVMSGRGKGRKGRKGK